MGLDSGPGPVLAFALVLAEWLGLGWLSGVRWPGERCAPWGPTWALRLLVGVLLVAFTSLLALLLGLPLRQPLLLLGIAAGLALLVRRVLPPAGPRVSRAPRATRAEAVGWAVLGLVLAAAFVRAWLVPEGGWDAYSHWGLKARAYFLAGSWITTHGAHEYYPPLVPLTQLWFYQYLGVADINVGKVVWAAVGSAFALALAWHLRLALTPGWVAPWVATGIVLGSVELLENFWTSQADLAVTVFLVLSALALFQWQRSSPADAAQRRLWLAQALLFAGAAALSKHEGLFRVVIVAAALGFDGVLRRRGGWTFARTAVLYVAVAAVLFAPWALFRTLHGIEVGSEHIRQFHPNAVDDVLIALGKTLGGVRTGGGLAVAVLAIALAGTYVLRTPLRFLFLVCLGQTAGTLLAFLVTGNSPEQQVYLVATRLLMQFSPLLLFLAAACLLHIIRVTGDESGTVLTRTARFSPPQAREVASL